MAARTGKIRHDENTRKKIQAAQIINRLQKCINGEVELSSQQVSSAKTLLNKVLPDLKSVELSGPDGGAVEIDITSLTDEDLAKIATGGSGDTAPTQG